jgi:AcrR family transcriptional regulator
MATRTRDNRRAARLDRRTRSARAEGRDARDSLLDAALEEVAERGYREASVDRIAERAGYSKGAVYWNFDGKPGLFLALLEERLDAGMRQMIDLLQAAPPGQDMGEEGSRRFGEVVRRNRDLLLLEHDYWAQAIRDPDLRERYALRQAELRSALGVALEARMRHLGGPPLEVPPEHLAAVFLALLTGLGQAKLMTPDAVPDALLGRSFVWIFAGLSARARAEKA